MELDLFEIQREVFGVNPAKIIGFAGDISRIAINGISDDNFINKGLKKFAAELPIIEDELGAPKSPLGTIVHGAVQLTSQKLNFYENGKIVSKTDHKPMYFPFSTVFECSRTKAYTITDLTAAESVVETSGHNNWNIRATGLILPNEQLYGGELQLTLDEVYDNLSIYENCVDGISVSGLPMSKKGIHQIFITAIDFPQPRGLNLSKMIPFVINAISVTPVELIENYTTK